MDQFNSGNPVVRYLLRNFITIAYCDRLITPSPYIYFRKKILQCGVGYL